jgi:dihydrodipicolinate synthase/N-acetylneuraminate lyase
MGLDTLRARTRGIVVFAPTPFVERGGRTLVDVKGLEGNVEFLAQAGIPVVVVCGGVGELWDLSAGEHRQVVETAARQAAGRLVVFAGVYGDAAASISRSRQAEEAGADGVLLFPEDEAVPTAEALVDYYARVGRAIGIGMMPFRADERVDIPVLRRLAALPQVVALKEERERMDEFQEIALALGDQLSVIGAGDAFAPSYLVLGGAGLACSFSNFLPDLYLQMWEAGQQGEYARVMEIHNALVPLNQLRRRFGLRLIKAALELRGLAGGPCRSEPPRLTSGEREELAEVLGRFTPVAV